MKLIISIFLILLFGCTHPESEEYNRDRKTYKFNSSSREEMKKDNFSEENLIRKALENQKQVSVIKMKKKGGVYFIPVLVNGVEMSFIFDTGASSISISETEAKFLYKQGKITENDILGSSNFSDANGDISEGIIINLKTVQIGDFIIKNVEASVVLNQVAPLLFGQSALSRFGKVSIDYNNEELTLE
ncbi:retropepsin-like aspartic protease family protein [Aquirufa sp. ROCK-SH2]